MNGLALLSSSDSGQLGVPSSGGPGCSVPAPAQGSSHPWVEIPFAPLGAKAGISVLTLTGPPRATVAGSRLALRDPDAGAAMLSPGTAAFPPLGALSRVRAHRPGAAGRRGPHGVLGATLSARCFRTYSPGSLELPLALGLFAPRNSFGEERGENPCEHLSGTFPRPWTGNGVGESGEGRLIVC